MWRRSSPRRLLSAFARLKADAAVEAEGRRCIELPDPLVGADECGLGDVLRQRPVAEDQVCRSDRWKLVGLNEGREAADIPSLQSRD